MIQGSPYIFPLKLSGRAQAMSFMVINKKVQKVKSFLFSFIKFYSHNENSGHMGDMKWNWERKAGSGVGKAEF